MISFTAAMTALLPKPVAAAIARIPADFWLLYGNVALYALCFQLQQPTQLYLVKSLVVGEAAAGQFAWLKTVNGVLQLAGSLLSGILIDRFGIRAVFVLSLVASALSYALVALPVDDVRILFLAQLPTVLQHAVLAARAYVSLNASPAERAVQLGYVGVAYGVGMVAGPALGGVLGSISLRLPAALATVGSLVSIALLLAAPAHSHKHGRGEPERSGAGAAFSAAPASGASVSPQQPPRAGSAVGAAEKPPTGAGAGGPPAGAPSGRSAAPRAGGHALSKYGRFFTTPLLRARLGLKLLFSAAMALFYSVYQLVAADRFGLDAKGAGYLMSFIGVLGMITQAVAVSALKRRFSERTLSLASAAGLVLCFSLFAQISTPPELFALCVPLVLLTTTFQQLNSSQIAEASPDELKGTAVAVDMAMFSGLRMLTPAVGVSLLESVGFWSIGASSAGAAALMLLCMLSWPATVQAQTDAGAATAGGGGVTAGGAVGGTKPHAE